MGKRLFAGMLALCLLCGCTPQAIPGSTGIAAVPSNSSTAGTLPSGPALGMAYPVTFVTGPGEETVRMVGFGETLEPPIAEPVPGKTFAGWFEAEDGSGAAFDFSRPVTGALTLYALWNTNGDRICYSYAGYECAALEWEEEDPSHSRVSYRLTGTEGYTYVDEPLIRAKDDKTARVDILGLQGNAHYDFLIECGDGSTLLVENMQISAYDRSGYAHFGYTEGVGAYADAGILKSGALVIYLTEENKNNVLDFAYSGGKKVDITPYMKDYSGIGEMLNNRRYNSPDRYDVGIAKLCQIYGAVTIRVLGKVTAEQNADGTSTIAGLTDYNAYGNGGAPGDNGRMARMVNAKNLTIEGVGEDACLDGWGIHFIADDEGNHRPGAGDGFEVRNLRFAHYPEDAVGMEGQQKDNQLTDPVQRCWIHHNSFYPGYCQKPAESDKTEGDGSCDFKRGRYYTLSYNYFVDCHKTNLIGSGDTSLQYDISFHHNYWENCGSRMPLVRNANLHFYNNYVFCDVTQDYGSTGQKLGLSYVASVRANSFMFSENNYFDGCKSVVELKSGGAVKAYGNTYYACFKTDSTIKVDDREAEIQNSCQYAYGGIDYSAFDTNPALFYYNSQEKRSNCYLTDAVTARQEVLQQAGTQKRKDRKAEIHMNHFTPESPVQMEGSALVIELGSIAQGSTVNGIYFNGKGSSGRLKGKHQVVTFALEQDTCLHVSISGSKPENYGELVDSQGKVWAGKFVEFSGVLPAGTYFIASGSKDKEVVITKLSFTLPEEQ